MVILAKHSKQKPCFSWPRVVFFLCKFWGAKNIEKHLRSKLANNAAEMAAKILEIWLQSVLWRLGRGLEDNFGAIFMIKGSVWAGSGGQIRR